MVERVLYCTIQWTISKTGTVTCEHLNRGTFVMAKNTENGLNIVLICPYGTMCAATKEKEETNQS